RRRFCTYLPHPAQRRRRIEKAQAQIRVGNRRLGPTAPVTGRAWVGSGRPGAHAKSPTRVAPSHAPATGADRVDLGGGDGEGKARDRSLARGSGPAGLDQRRVRGGSAHVEGNQVRVAG